MEKRIRLSVVSYLNSKPFVYGLFNSGVQKNAEISLDIPSKVAAKLEYDQADVGLVPVAALIENDQLEIITKKCIGSKGKVRTVVLASQVPVEQVETILMDYQSRTSVVLAKVLAKNFWKKSFNWENTTSGFENKLIEKNTAAVVIGDRVFEIEKRYKYIYDLSNEWLKFTGLPFVFAVWAANKSVEKKIQKELCDAFNLGLNNLDKVVSSEEKNYSGIDIFEYLTENIQFELDNEMNKGMQLFFELAKKLEPV
ncbi:MAG: menaquinone biosynthesis protein [Prolixibacteraceae bacterium]|nr:menaquinone biosynthesis protein [Prolixibacteraceae bacterium]MBN2772910.1 menaquinone biosynthesis protein [Prolixibacteraceae bacterium]